MENFTHEEMHHDHQHWQCDIALWRDEIELWKAESKKALGDLVHIETALRRLIQTTSGREQSLDQHEQRIRAHEHSVSEFEKSGAGDDLRMLTLAKTHQQEVTRHADERLAHEHLKKEHLVVMAHWNVLLRELTRSRSRQAPG